MASAHLAQSPGSQALRAHCAVEDDLLPVSWETAFHTTTPGVLAAGSRMQGFVRARQALY